jgi:hypothetical protein
MDGGRLRDALVATAIARGELRIVAKGEKEDGIAVAIAM